MLASHSLNLENNSNQVLSRQFITSAKSDRDDLILIELQGNIFVSKNDPVEDGHDPLVNGHDPLDPPMNDHRLDLSQLESQIRIGEINLSNADADADAGSDKVRSYLAQLPDTCSCSHVFILEIICFTGKKLI